jgi:hypothetical protein
MNDCVVTLREPLQVKYYRYYAAEICKSEELLCNFTPRKYWVSLLRKGWVSLIGFCRIEVNNLFEGKSVCKLSQEKSTYSEKTV